MPERPQREPAIDGASAHDARDTAAAGRAVERGVVPMDNGTTATQVGSEGYFQGVLDALPSLIAVLDEEGTITSVNAAWEHAVLQCGATLAAMGVGVNYFAVCEQASGPSSEGATSVLQGLREVLTEQRSTFEMDYPCPTQEEDRWFNLRATPFVAGGRRFLVVSHENVTGRRQAIDQITQLLAGARCLLWQAIVTDVDGVLHWRIEIRNTEAAQKLCPVRFLPGQDFAAAFHHAKLAEEAEDKDRLSREAIRLGMEGYRQEFSVRLASGELQVLYEDAKIERLSEDKWRVTGACIDITERKRMEQALRKSELQFSNAFENAAVGMALVSGAGEIVRVNESLCEIVGYSSEELRQLRLPELAIDTDSDVLLSAQQLSQLASGGVRSYHIEHRIHHKSGRVVWGLLSISLLTDPEEEPLLYCIQIQDISAMKDVQAALIGSRDRLEERVKERTNSLEIVNRELLAATEEAKAANRAKGEFLSRMSHELRTPLNAIIGFGQILSQRNLPAFESESLRYILKAGHQLLELVNEILMLTEMDDGTDATQLDRLDILEVVLGAVRVVEPIAAARGIRVRLSHPDSSSLLASADRRHLERVLFNLLSNAVKYNVENGKVEVSILRKPTGTWRISVVDWGPGIPPDRQADVFAPFERLEADRTGIPGAGLGLTLSRRLVKAMGGELQMESLRGNGTVFWFELQAVADA